jgi:hypothetical protein
MAIVLAWLRPPLVLALPLLPSLPSSPPEAPADAASVFVGPVEAESSSEGVGPAESLSLSPLSVLAVLVVVLPGTASKSVDSNIIRMPYAFTPPGDFNVVVLVPSPDSVQVRTAPLLVALQVQNKLSHLFPTVSGFWWHDKVVPGPYTGQHVTVVWLSSPLVSMQAVRYPLGQAMPGEKNMF